MVIFIFSSEFGSSEKTLLILKKVIDCFYYLDNTQLSIINYYFRFLGHIFVYIFLYLFLFRALKGHFGFDSIRSSFEAVSMTLVIALVDEWHQSLIPSRTSKMSDIFLDLSGVALLAIITIIWAKINKNKMKKSYLNAIILLIEAGDLYHKQGNYPLAAHFYKKALDIFNEHHLTI